jgi:hypothetical protein
VKAFPAECRGGPDCRITGVLTREEFDLLKAKLLADSWLEDPQSPRPGAPNAGAPKG